MGMYTHTKLQILTETDPQALVVSHNEFVVGQVAGQ